MGDFGSEAPAKVCKRSWGTFHVTLQPTVVSKGNWNMNQVITREGTSHPASKVRTNFPDLGTADGNLYRIATDFEKVLICEVI